MTSTEDRWEKVLDPEVVQPSLFKAMMFITSFEILKDSIIDRIRDFYTNGWDETGAIVGSQYQSEVGSRSKSALYASLDWLREHEVIDESDLQAFEQIKKTRNQLAHKLFAVVTGQVESDHTNQFEVLVGLLRKIEVWWVANLEIPTNPDYDGKDIDETGIVPGAVLSLQMLIEVASGNTDLLEHWRSARKHRAA